MTIVSAPAGLWALTLHSPDRTWNIEPVLAVSIVGGETEAIYGLVGPLPAIEVGPIDVVVRHLVALAEEGDALEPGVWHLDPTGVLLAGSDEECRWHPEPARKHIDSPHD